MMTFIKIFFTSCALFFFFLVVTFPYQRLAPKARVLLENGLSQIGFQPSCSISGLDIALPLNLAWSKIDCSQGAQSIIDLGPGSLSALPNHQSLTATLGKGELAIKANAGLKSPAKRIQVQLTKAPIDKLTPLIVGLISAQNPRLMIPKTLKIEGLADATIDLPIQNYSRDSGKIDIQLLQLRIPQQSFLELFGLKDISFTKGVVKADLKNGKLGISELALLSPQLSLKIEGGADLQDDIAKSIGPITVKWKVQKSDALLASPMGRALAEGPCPAQDSEGFCSRKYQRLGEMFAVN